MRDKNGGDKYEEEREKTKKFSSFVSKEPTTLMRVLELNLSCSKTGSMITACDVVFGLGFS